MAAASQILTKITGKLHTYRFEIDGDEFNAGEVMQRLVSALEWYGEEVLTYSITQESEPRSAAHADRGRKAREALRIGK